MISDMDWREQTEFWRKEHLKGDMNIKDLNVDIRILVPAAVHSFVGTVSALCFVKEMELCG